MADPVEQLSAFCHLYDSILSVSKLSFINFECSSILSFYALFSVSISTSTNQSEVFILAGTASSSSPTVMELTKLILFSALLSAVTSLSLTPITISGNGKHLPSDPRLTLMANHISTAFFQGSDRFYIRGVDYQLSKILSFKNNPVSIANCCY
jgi:hypothetical protein